MTRFLIREFQQTTRTVGRKQNVPVTEVVIREIDCPSGKLPRISKGYESIGQYQNGNSYVPWAVRADGRVVYTQTGGHSGWNSGCGLRKYDSLLSHERRRLCESELGMLALTYSSLTSDAVQQVSQAIKYYLTRLWFKDQQGTQDLLQSQIGHYFYTQDEKNPQRVGMGFGRIAEKTPSSVGGAAIYRQILEKLTAGRLEQIMSIHDAVGRKILPKTSSGPRQDYDNLGPEVRQPWFDDPAKRGRANAATRATATQIGGTAPASAASQINSTIQARNRGVDMFTRDQHRTRQPDADNYYDDVDARHLLFGAGISGTTGTLLQSAKAFGKLNGENLKQYVLAIVGYLVGGGMHSYHETMAVAAKAGVAYSPGKFIPSLPQKFLNSIHFRKWHEKYYDIVELGAIHWMYNTTCLPSHMNKQLTCATCGKLQSACSCRR